MAMEIAKPRNSLSLLKLIATLFFSLLAASAPSLSAAADTDAFIYGGCSQPKYSPASPYESNLNSLLTSLVNSATYAAYNNFTILGSAAGDTARGLFQCRGDLSMPDCATCVARAVSQVGSLCPGACGGALQLGGCYIKYDNVSFLGVEDKTVVLKKCGPSEGYDTEEMGRRDAVLTGLLSGGGGYYRAGGSGEVQGVAQCVGDLTVGKCQDCLATAIGMLKSDCGTAVYGDMFLGKCYARYSTGGAQYYAKAHNGNVKTSNEGEKTFAIIIGLLAGVALLIIFLLFLRRIFGANGK